MCGEIGVNTLWFGLGIIVGWFCLCWCGSSVHTVSESLGQVRVLLRPMVVPLTGGYGLFVPYG